MRDYRHCNMQLAVSRFPLKNSDLSILDQIQKLDGMCYFEHTGMNIGQMLQVSMSSIHKNIIRSLTILSLDESYITDNILIENLRSVSNSSF